MSTVDVTDETFPESVLGAEKPVLVDFWAEWCGPCKLVSPIVDQIGDELGEQLTVVKLDIDQNVATATRYSVFSIPTLVLFKGGEEVERVVGYKRKDDLTARLTPHL